MEDEFLGEFAEESEKDDFYNKNILESLVEDDEISPYEEAFMSGYMA